MSKPLAKRAGRHLWLVRHATPMIKAGICYGRTDMPAKAADTLDCATRLAPHLPANLAVFSSPLQRCEQLAQALCGLRADLTYKNDVRLQEMDFGYWEGCNWADIAPNELASWTDDFAAYKAGGTGESVHQFMTRVGAAFDQIQTGCDTLWITHAGVIRSASLIASGQRSIARADQWPTEAPAYGQWCKLSLGL